MFYGSPQWQIEALRRIEIPEDMQERHGFAPLGGARSEVKEKILGRNGARLYQLNPDADEYRNDEKIQTLRRACAAAADKGDRLLAELLA